MNILIFMIFSPVVLNGVAEGGTVAVTGGFVAVITGGKVGVGACVVLTVGNGGNVARGGDVGEGGGTVLVKTAWVGVGSITAVATVPD